MSEMQEGIQMAMMTGQAMAFVVDKAKILWLLVRRATTRKTRHRAVLFYVYKITL